MSLADRIIRIRLGDDFSEHRNALPNYSPLERYVLYRLPPHPCLGCVPPSSMDAGIALRQHSLAHVAGFDFSRI